MFRRIKAGKGDFTEEVPTGEGHAGDIQRSGAQPVDAQGAGDGSSAGDRTSTETQISDKEKKSMKDRGAKREKKSKASEQTLDTSQLLKKKDDRNI